MYNQPNPGHPPRTLRMWAPTEGAPPKRKTEKMPKQSRPKLPKGMKNKNRQRPLWFRIMKWSLISGLGLFALGIGTIAFLFWYWGGDLPEITKLSDYKWKQVTVILDSAGKTSNDRIGEIYPDQNRRTFVSYDEIPKVMTDAIVAVEDKDFWTHGGVDYWGIVRAFVSNIRGHKQGGSTITQQVVKNMLLSPKQTYKRKIQEIILARRLEKNLNKKEILALYLNQIFLGHNCYGVAEAARFYFGVEVSQLNIGQAALLAGLPQSPNAYSPINHPEAAKERQVHVLQRMRDEKKITPEQAQYWADMPIANLLAKAPVPNLGTAPEWVELVKKELVAQKGKDAVETLGAEVRTTLDVKLQESAQAALQKGLRASDARNKIGRPHRKVKPDQVIAEETKLGKKLPSDRKPKLHTTYEAVVTAVNDDGELDVDLGGYPAVVVLGGPEDERLNPPDDKGVRKSPGERFGVGDIVDVVALPDDTKPAKNGKPRVAFTAGAQGAIVVIEVKSRKVRALVGGYDTRSGDFDRALSAERQPGSSFKPFVYAAALASKKFTPASQLNDTAEVFSLWRPQNYKKDSFEGPVLLRHALAKSINTIAIKVAYETGVPNIADLAESMGITTTLPRELSLSLGSGVVRPIDMANAYATFAAGGKYAPPRFIESIDGADASGPEAKQVLAPEVAYVTLDMMRSVVEEGTGQLAKKVGVPIAGKTGTSNDARDTWFMGVTPDYVIAVWVGNDDNHPMGPKETGGTTAVPIFVDVAKSMKLTAKAFPRPPHVETARIDKATGLISPPGAPHDSSYDEVFIEGTKPTEVAPMPGDVTSTTLVTDDYGD
jgi:penicillin-binding protein 1A